MTDTEAASAERPSAERPSAERPSAEEPSAEEPSAEEPSAEEPSDRAPSAERPSANAPPSTLPRRARRAGLCLACWALAATVLLSTNDAPGTVSEQRARLPPPADCGDDPIVGYWRSHQHYPQDLDWTEFTLVIKRVAGSETELLGEIENHAWKGGAEREQPGRCGPEQPYRVRVKMPAKGEIVDDVVRFEGTSWKLDEVVCGDLPLGWYYNLDRFTGKIDPKIQEFQSVNNDGGRMVNHPTVFRRIRCLDGPPSPSVDIKPPPIFPERSSGCGCSLAVGR